MGKASANPAFHLINLRQNAAMDPCQRRWWRLLDDLPAHLGAVHRWVGLAAPPATGSGGLHAVPTSVVCLAGVVRARRPGAVLDLHPGEALLIAPGVWHQHEALRPGAVVFAQGFLATCSDVLLRESGRGWYGRLPSQPSRNLMEAALGSADAAQRRRRFGELIAQVLAEPVSDLGFDHPALDRMIDRMWSGLHRGLTVTQVLAASGLSRAQAYRLFTMGYGLPPKRAMEQSRLWLARGLLEAGCSRGAAARGSGFTSTDSLRRAERRAAGARGDH
jgi:AraC-like DNA-binding protein